MLILSRSKEEVILVGNEITIKVLHISGDSVRLGITAPKDVIIRREELKGPWRTKPTYADEKVQLQEE